MMHCTKSNTCLNYKIRCDVCKANSDIYNHYPSYNDRDLVEVVRCKDCKYFDQYSCLYSDDPSGFGKCEKIRMDIDLTIDDFCSYGERREEDA